MPGSLTLVTFKRRGVDLHLSAIDRKDSVIRVADEVTHPLRVALAAAVGSNEQPGAARLQKADQGRFASPSGSSPGGFNHAHPPLAYVDAATEKWVQSNVQR